ncbi:MAG: hypothetical protein GXX96_03550 [Planctomycetaceae bacterium]|jgi:hypothetical protein|nr:hypothetical protein [Planctomycetaceae bacterium]
MHTVELVREAIALAQRAGYRIRQEYLGSAMGGGCEFGGRKWVFLDVSSGPADQLDQLLGVLRHNPAVTGMPMSDELRNRVAAKKTA